MKDLIAEDGLLREFAAPGEKTFKMHIQMSNFNEENLRWTLEAGIMKLEKMGD